MLFSEEVLASVKDDPIRGALEVIELTRGNLVDDTHEWRDDDHRVLLEAYALLSELIESGLLDISPPTFSLTGLTTGDCVNISRWLSTVEERLKKHYSDLQLRSLRTHFRTALGNGFHYEFSQGDLDKIQTLLNQLQDLVSKSTLFEKDHQRRLLKRLENLQAELHKRVSDVDKFWGLIGDAGVAMGKFGMDAKPIVDRIKEIADIVWRTQSRAEELPSDASFPLLSNKDKEEP